MIELNFTGMCEDCHDADLEVHCLTTLTGNIWVVTCNHNNACQRMKAKREVKE